MRTASAIRTPSPRNEGHGQGAAAVAAPPATAGVGSVTESLQLPLPFVGLEARPYGSILVSNVGTYGLDSASAPVPTFYVPITILLGAVGYKALAETVILSFVRCCP